MGNLAYRTEFCGTTVHSFLKPIKPGLVQRTGQISCNAVDDRHCSKHQTDNDVLSKAGRTHKIHNQNLHFFQCCQKHLFTAISVL
jgi:hypothetical protein